MARPPVAETMLARLADLTSTASANSRTSPRLACVVSLMLFTATAAATPTAVPAFLSWASWPGGASPNSSGSDTPSSGSLSLLVATLPPASFPGSSSSPEALASEPATVKVNRPPETLARAVTLPTTSMWIGSATVPSASSSSPMTARVLRSVLLMATAMPTPMASLLATPPAQLICVSRLPA